MYTLTPERLRELLHYDPNTGVFVWTARTSNRVRVGTTISVTFPTSPMLSLHAPKQKPRTTPFSRTTEVRND